MFPSNVARPSTKRSGSGYGSGRMNVRFIVPNMATLAPMPTARTRMTTAVKPGAFVRVRPAYRMSCQMFMRGLDLE